MSSPVILSKETLVPIGVVVLIAGGIFWMSTIFVEQRNGKERDEVLLQRVSAIENRQNDQDKFQVRLDEKLNNFVELLTEVRDTVKNLTAQPSSRTSK